MIARFDAPIPVSPWSTASFFPRCTAVVLPHDLVRTTDSPVPESLYTPTTLQAAHLRQFNVRQSYFFGPGVISRKEAACIDRARRTKMID